jgi:23S rRNA pseudouridine955/2504/2580 synthase
MAGPRGQDRRGKPSVKPAGKPSRQRPGGGAAAGKRRRAFSDRDERPAFAKKAFTKKAPASGPRKAGARRRPSSDTAERRPAAPVKAAPIQKAVPVQKTVQKTVEAPVQQATRVQTVAVTADEAGMRVDRFLEAKFPGLSFSHIHRVIRKGELRVNGKRVDGKDRLEEGQAVRIPPLKVDAPKTAVSEADEKTAAFLKSITLYEDADVLVFNKPMGLAVQGGSGTTRHLDGMLDVMRDDATGQRPRLVHRLDKDTSGCLLVAKTRFAASALAQVFRSREARKIYWALVAGVPKPHQGRISTFLAKEEREDESVMRIAKHGEEGASHAVTYYAVVETSAQQLAWASLKPVTGRTHQLRAHMAHIGHAIVGDPKYFNKENWQLPGGIQNRLHLLARRIAVPHPRGGIIDVTAPLPPHMVQSWNLLGLDLKRYDPIADAPEE